MTTLSCVLDFFVVEKCRQATWSVNKKMVIFGGEANKLTLHACMDKCASRLSCLAVSYNHHEKTKDNCWLHDPTSGTNMVSVHDVKVKAEDKLKTLYTIKRRTDCSGNFVFTVIDNKCKKTSKFTTPCNLRTTTKQQIS